MPILNWGSKVPDFASFWAHETGKNPVLTRLFPSEATHRRNFKSRQSCVSRAFRGTGKALIAAESAFYSPPSSKFRSIVISKNRIIEKLGYRKHTFPPKIRLLTFGKGLFLHQKEWARETQSRFFNAFLTYFRRLRPHLVHIYPRFRRFWVPFRHFQMPFRSLYFYSGNFICRVESKKWEEKVSPER